MLESVGVVNLGTFVLGVAAIMIAPGPNSLFVLSTGARFGRRAGARAMAGIFLGDAVLMFLASAGAAAAVALYPLAFNVIRYAGAAYLGFIGLRILFSQIRRQRQPEGAAAGAAEGHFFVKALLLAFSNPNTIIFYLAFFIQFVHPDRAGDVLPFFVLACIVELVSVSYLSLLILAGARLAEIFRQRATLVRLFRYALGLLFLGFGLRLLISGLQI